MTIVRPLSYVRLNPWEGFRRLQQELNDLMLDSLHEVSSGYPPLNVWYNDERAVIEAELPGVAKEDLDIEVMGNTLTIKGQRRARAVQTERVLLREERGYGRFARTIQLPFDVAAGGIDASLQNGILTLILPRKEEDKPKKIQIAAA